MLAPPPILHAALVVECQVENQESLNLVFATLNTQSLKEVHRRLHHTLDVQNYKGTCGGYAIMYTQSKFKQHHFFSPSKLVRPWPAGPAL